MHVYRGMTDKNTPNAADSFDKGWRKVPSNTLAPGDVIKILQGTLAPAFIRRVQYLSDNQKSELKMHIQQQSLEFDSENFEFESDMFDVDS
jgi:magnesium-transporting ATPase (P-type)